MGAKKGGREKGGETSSIERTSGALRADPLHKKSGQITCGSFPSGRFDMIFCKVR